MRKWKVMVFCVVLLALIPIGFCWLLPRILFHEIYRKESEATDPSVAQVVGRELALLCQTCRVHPDWFPYKDYQVPAWTPELVLKMEPSWVEIKEDGAQVEFGGGLHHFGYRLEMALPQAKGELQNTWVLYFYSEAADDRELSRFTLMSDAVLTEPQFEKLKKSENDRRMTK